MLVNAMGVGVVELQLRHAFGAQEKPKKLVGVSGDEVTLRRLLLKHLWHEIRWDSLIEINESGAWLFLTLEAKYYYLPGILLAFCTAPRDEAIENAFRLILMGLEYDVQEDQVWPERYSKDQLRALLIAYDYVGEISGSKPGFRFYDMLFSAFEAK